MVRADPRFIKKKEGAKFKDSEKSKALADEIGGEAVDMEQVITDSDYIFLGLKPQILPAVAPEIKEIAQKDEKRKVLISMAAGVTLDSLKEYFGEDTPIIRIMPNTPVSIGEGVVQYCVSSEITAEEKGEFTQILGCAGELIEIGENLIDAGCAVAGCGPAFVDIFISALADGGVACGLPRQTALKLAGQTVKGTASFALKSGEHPEKLKDDVCSPGGATIEGVKTLEDNAFRASVINAVSSAYKKTVDLGKH